MTKEEFAHKWAFPQCNEERMLNELSELIESHEQEAWISAMEEATRRLCAYALSEKREDITFKDWKGEMK